MQKSFPKDYRLGCADLNILQRSLRLPVLHESEVCPSRSDLRGLTHTYKIQRLSTVGGFFTCLSIFSVTYSTYRCRTCIPPGVDAEGQWNAPAKVNSNEGSRHQSMPQIITLFCNPSHNIEVTGAQTPLLPLTASSQKYHASRGSLSHVLH
jgi:hypothetical protein